MWSAQTLTWWCPDGPADITDSRGSTREHAAALPSAQSCWTNLKHGSCSPLPQLEKAEIWKPALPVVAVYSGRAFLPFCSLGAWFGWMVSLQLLLSCSRDVLPAGQSGRAWVVRAEDTEAASWLPCSALILPKPSVQPVGQRDVEPHTPQCLNSQSPLRYCSPW